MLSPIEFGREADGRWIAEIPNVPGAMAYGATKNEAPGKARAIARVADPQQAD
jgi:predicted RNase H-like HicB family nuclease